MAGVLKDMREERPQMERPSHNCKERRRGSLPGDSGPVKTPTQWSRSPRKSPLTKVGVCILEIFYAKTMGGGVIIDRTLLNPIPPLEGMHTWG